MDEKRRGSFLQHKQELFKDKKHLKDIISVYDRWSQDYDKDVQYYEYNTFKKIVQLLLKVIKTETNITKSCSVVDICAGTGLVGEYLHSSGFRGQIDAVDGSFKMLEVAKGKGVYSRIFCHVIEPGTPMPPELSRSDYDVAIACSCFRSIFVHWSCLKDLVNAVRVGGLIVFGLKRVRNEDMFTFYMQMKQELFRLECKGVLVLVDLQFNSRYRRQEDKSDVKTYGCIDYCFKKLTEYSNE